MDQPAIAIATSAAETWETAIQQLIDAARDTAEFLEGKPIGRSRQASICRLAQALDQLRATEIALAGRIPATHPRAA